MTQQLRGTGELTGGSGNSIKVNERETKTTLAQSKIGQFLVRKTKSENVLCQSKNKIQNVNKQIGNALLRRTKKRDVCFYRHDDVYDSTLEQNETFHFVHGRIKEISLDIQLTSDDVIH